MEILRYAAIAVFLNATVGTVAAAQSPAPWRLEPIATIEGPTDDEPFGMVRHMALHADGRLVVVDMKPPRVTMFDARGKFIGVIGRTGSGPGEYRDPYSVAWLGDTLAIYDPREARILFMTQGASYLRVQRMMSLSGPYHVRFYPVSGRKAYLWQSTPTGRGSVFVGVGSGRPDTIVVPQASDADMIACRVGSEIRMLKPPAALRSIAVPVAADGSIAVGSNLFFDLQIMRDGQQVGSVKRTDFVYYPMSDVHWSLELSEYNAHVQKYGQGSCRNKPQRPPHVPAVKAVTVADNGDIWVYVTGRNESGFHVFSPTGQWRGRVVPPAGLFVEIPVVVSGDRAAFVLLDKDGVQTVRLFRIIRH